MSVVGVGRIGRDQTLTVAGLGGIALAVAAAIWATSHLSYDIWGGLVVAPVLLALSLPLVARVARVEPDPRVVRLVMWGLVFKLAASFGRYLLTFALYDRADAVAYSQAGAALAGLFRQGIFVFDLGKPLMGTGFIEVVTGVVYTFTGPTLLGGFLVFSWLAYWGLYCFYRAFRIAYPDGDGVRYALLLFFLPSLLFWPSSLGKESWMLFTLGVSTYGIARVLTHRASGYPLLCLGLLGVTMVRPHMSALLCCGMVFGYLARRSPAERSHFGPVTRVVGMAVLLALSVVIITQAERFFGVEGQGTAESVDTVLAYTQQQSTQGGSEYETAPVRSPIALPAAIVTVLFRPFPFEARNAQSLIASAEGLALLGLVAISLPRLATLLSQLRRNPYLIFAALYSLLFIVAFSHVGNFGILTRQRAQLFPLALVFLALPIPMVATQANRRRVRN
ncbi:MAG: hypothetical protein ACRDYX_01205 [Egibacteraceae bacterium]